MCNIIYFILIFIFHWHSEILVFNVVPVSCWVLLSSMPDESPSSHGRSHAGLWAWRTAGGSDTLVCLQTGWHASQWECCAWHRNNTALVNQAMLAKTGKHLSVFKGTVTLFLIINTYNISITNTAVKKKIRSLVRFYESGHSLKKSTLLWNSLFVFSVTVSHHHRGILLRSSQQRCLSSLRFVGLCWCTAVSRSRHSWVQVQSQPL